MSAVHPLGICKISGTNMLIIPLNETCDILPHSYVTSDEPLRLETTHCQICMLMRNIFCSVIEGIIRA